VAATLRHYDGNQARAAAHLGVHPSNFSRMLKRMGLR
jgi:DNA-binding protein Fis